jgi:HK97 family phage major capsid protein
MAGWMDKKPELLDELKSALETQGLEITKLKMGGGETKVKTIRELLVEKSVEIKNLFDRGDKFKMSLDLKNTNSTRASITTDKLGQTLTDIGQLKSKRLTIADLFAQFPMSPDSHGVIHYTDQSTATRNAAARTEGNLAGSSVLAWTGYTANLREISDSIPVSKEILRDITLMEAEVRNFIVNNLLLKENLDLLTGDGNAPDLKGINAYATAFDAAAYVAASGYQPKDASLYDLIVVMANEIMKDSKYMVDTVICHPTDILSMKLKKDANNNYILPPFSIMSGDGSLSIDNIKVIPSADQTVNTCIIGDFSKARRYFNGQIELEWGYDLTGDFSKRIMTLVGNLSELLLVRTAETTAFLRSSAIATDITTITTI